MHLIILSTKSSLHFSFSDHSVMEIRTEFFNRLRHFHAHYHDLSFGHWGNTISHLNTFVLSKELVLYIAARSSPQFSANNTYHRRYHYHNIHPYIDTMYESTSFWVSIITFYDNNTISYVTVLILFNLIKYFLNSKYFTSNVENHPSFFFTQDCMQSNATPTRRPTPTCCDDAIAFWQFHRRNRHTMATVGFHP